MTIGEKVQLQGNKPTYGEMVPVSITSGWATLLDAGLIATADNAGNPINRAATQVIRAGTHPASFAQFGGTNIMARVRYPAAVTVITTQPQLSFRGRTGDPTSTPPQEWEQRKNIQGVDLVTLSLDPANDEVSADGAWKYSYCDPGVHVWDRLGCELMLPCVVTGAVGNASFATATLEGKPV